MKLVAWIDAEALAPEVRKWIVKTWGYEAPEVMLTLAEIMFALDDLGFFDGPKVRVFKEDGQWVVQAPGQLQNGIVSDPEICVALWGALKQVLVRDKNL